MYVAPTGSLVLETDATTLPEPTGPTDGVSLDDLKIGQTRSLVAETERTLPASLLLYVFGGVGQTVNVDGPVEILILRDGRWYSAGQLQGGADPFALTPNRSYSARLWTGADWERAKLVSPGSITGGEVSAVLVGEDEVGP